MARPEEPPPVRPSPAAGDRDLSAAEFDELAGLLAGIPDLLDPLALDEADGYLAAIAVQPRAIDPAQWLRFVFDREGHRWGEEAPSAERARASELLIRRERAIRHSLAESGSFDPWLPDAEDAADPIGATLRPWMFGFVSAIDRFPLADEPGRDVVAGVLPRLERYLEGLDGGPVFDPPPTLEAGIDEILLGVFALYEEGERRRYRVAPATRVTPKVGRNDRCPCGSGRKFKQCHGATA